MNGPFRTDMIGPERRDLLNQLWARNMASWSADSTTPLAVGVGTKTLEVPPGLVFAPGQSVRVASASDPSGTRMDATVVAYAGTDLIVDVVDAVGSGTHSDWVVSISGATGERGPSGSTIYDSFGAMESDLDAPQDAGGIVTNDPNPALNGWYRKTGAAGDAGWERLANQPASSARLAEVEGRVRSVSVQSSFVPLAAADSGKVPVWLDGGALGARDLTPALREKAVRDVATRLEVASGQPVPLMRNRRGQIPLLWDDGLATPKLSESFKGQIRAVVGGIVDPSVFAHAVAPVTSKAPIATDGRSLFRLRAKIADLATGLSTQLRIGLAGDSWAEFTTIPEAMRDLLETKGYPRAGEGWQSVNTSFKMSGITLNRSAGWVFVDGSGNGPAYPYGAAPDGFSLYTTAATETLSLAGIQATRIRIFYRDVPGAWRYRVDSGGWQTVASAGAGALQGVDITGLSDTTHTLDIDTTGNTGAVSMCGFDAMHSDSGYVVHKIGNAGLRGQTMAQFTQYMEEPARHLDLDALIVFLGTNDFKVATSPPAVYINALRQLADAYRAATPDIGLIFVVPAESHGEVAHPLADYRDALYEFCIENGHEFYNMCDLFGSYAESNALGQWADNVHLNARGAMNVLLGINRQFLNL